MVAIEITAGRLAEIAEQVERQTPRSPYTVDVLTDSGDRADRATEIAFRRRPNGRRDRAIVEMNLCGRRAVFNADAVLRIAD